MCAVQEIKFEPCVMCEHLDNRASFRISQVCASLLMLENVIRLSDWQLTFCYFIHRSKMGT